MRYYKIPYTDLNVSRIALGTGEFGGTIMQPEAFYMLDSFCEAGGNLIDTAHIYCDWLTDTKSESEKMLGRWLKQTPYREKILISTKGAHPPLDDMSKSRLSYKDIVFDCDESLLFLGLDTIDLYWLHRDDVSHDVSEILYSLNELKKSGKIRRFGCSNWRYDRIEEANKYASKQGLEGFCASQINWSLAVPDFKALNDESLVCMDCGEKEQYINAKFPVFAFSSQAKGFFSKMASRGEQGLGIKADTRFNYDINQKRFEKALILSKELGISLSGVVLGYLTSHTIPAIAIMGCRTPEQLRDSLTAADVELPGWAVDYLEKD